MGAPPDKYIAIPLTGDLTADLDAINSAADEGYRFSGLIVTAPPNGYYAALMGNYKGSGS